MRKVYNLLISFFSSQNPKDLLTRYELLPSYGGMSGMVKISSRGETRLGSIDESGHTLRGL